MKNSEIAQDEYLNYSKQFYLLGEELSNIQQKQELISNKLTELYDYGIIPQDYRTFDCVTILDQIFRNDLADTMRDAIKIYEDRVFKGSVIRGMDKICTAIGNLSQGMEVISRRLDIINTNVLEMSNDLYNYNQSILNTQKDLLDETQKSRIATEDLINETQLGRYTNEKILESNKRLEYYAEEYRMGRMPRDFMN